MKNLITVILFLLSLSLAAQEYGQQQKNLPDYDQKWLHFGFTVGTNIMDFSIVKADDFFSETQFNQIYGIENRPNVGFHLGPISNLRLGEYFDFRLLINLSFGQRDLTYRLVEDTTAANPILSTHKMKLASTYLEFPLLLKYKAMRIDNYRPYLIAGINPKIDLAAQKKIKEEEMPKIRLKNLDIAWEIGAGIDFYLPYFKLSTELKYSAGINNMVVRDDTQYTNAIKGIHSNIWMISLHFE
ncbi:MAG: porin family protein [Bacteroidales bacterium]|nr:porin family protein [Bacteroidales bacterium]